MTYYTDGGCEPNPGRGAWAWVCKDTDEYERGTEDKTTNNRMELLAVLHAMKHGLDKGVREIIIYSDSLYVVNTFNGWMDNWAKSKKKWDSKKNLDILSQLYRLKHSSPIKISLKWVKGHNGDRYNEMADQMVRSAYEDEFGGLMKY